jgi:glyoxalase family protein
VRLPGIHHVTAIAGDPQQNADFYVGLLGLRLVKRSVNQDDPGTFHLFYADAAGHPGTDLTFFPWPGGSPGIDGAGQALSVAFAIPHSAAEYWRRRLSSAGVGLGGAQARFDEEVIAFRDPHGLRLELVAGPDTDDRSLWTPWEDGPVPPEFAIRGIHAVTAIESRAEPSAAFLTETLGFRLIAEAGERLRYQVGDGGTGAVLDVLVRPDERRGRVAVGTVHHVAWRTPDAGEQEGWRERIAARGVGVTPVIDRFWFRSIYFREPGGVLFEIATDGPGFAVDERMGELGSRLILPPWLEPRRKEIEMVLPPLRVPQPVR